MDYILIICFFFIALVYASVGFGGGTSYLALMGVMAVSFEVMRPAALLCNIVVVTGGTFIFIKEGLLPWRSTWPFLLVSIPMAFVGGQWPIQEHTFFRLLGLTLIVASFLLWFQDKFTNVKASDKKSGFVLLNVGIGGVIGFLSGLVSIGGGIFLSPVLHLMKWDQARRISALASVFILVNSISGLFGQLSRSGSLDWTFLMPLLLSVFIGGQIGSRLGAYKFNALYIRRITAVLILLAGANILINH